MTKDPLRMTEEHQLIQKQILDHLLNRLEKTWFDPIMKESFKEWIKYQLSGSYYRYILGEKT